MIDFQETFPGGIMSNRSLTPGVVVFVCFETFKISAYTKEGLEGLKEKIKKSVLDINPDDMEFVTNQRQQNCLYRAKTALERALEATNNHEHKDMIYIDVKSALLSLDEITGEVINDEILDNIFAHFCIGK